MEPSEVLSSLLHQKSAGDDPPIAANAGVPADQRAWVDLSAYPNSDFSPGRGFFIRGLWYVISLIFFESGWFPIRGFKVWLLRRFGARIGQGLVIKPQVRIKYPWRLVVGEHCWIGQGSWIDNLANVTLGDHVCISQGVYLCTGSHDYRCDTFDLITAPIVAENGSWIGAKAIVLLGCTIGANAVVAAGSVIRQSIAPAEIVAGNPSRAVSHREKPKGGG